MGEEVASVIGFRIAMPCGIYITIVKLSKYMHTLLKTIVAFSNVLGYNKVS